MKDIRRKAEEHARCRKDHTSQPFISERARAKEAVKYEVNAYTGEGVHKIAATSSQSQEDRVLRVAAYCRVSTDEIEQALSIELQKNNYRDMIRANPKWKYVGTYVDDGFSGTNTEHRPAFQLMMKDAMAGRMDMIITKSVSRFARNLVDCIAWVRRLKAHEPPIQVYFEQEKLNTMDSTSNIILFVLAMVAEEESHMKSEAMLLSLEWRFSRGRFLTPALLGYDKVEVPDNYGGHRKVLRINDEEAQTVRLMYYMLLNGSSTAEIADTLTELGRMTGLRKACGKERTTWTASMVTATMRNERYCGDVLARKTWTPDFKDHRSVRNRGGKNRYFQPGHHEAIVTRAQWNAAQRILNSHTYSHRGGYLPMRVIDHGILTGFISINRRWAGHEVDEYFRASNIAMGLTEGELDVDLESMYLPDAGRRLPGLTDEGGIQRIARKLTKAEEAMKAQMEGENVERGDALEEAVPEIKPGFQIASGSMFSHKNDPCIRITPNGFSFDRSCVTRMSKGRVADPLKETVRYVELLINPVERLLAVRPCDREHLNAIAWTDKDGYLVHIRSKAFCSKLYEMLGWDESYNYQALATVRTRGEERLILFDLDNYIGVKRHEPVTVTGVKEDTALEIIRHENSRGIFYGAEDDEPQPIVDSDEETLMRLMEYERKHFGVPAFEEDASVRVFADSDWSSDSNVNWDAMAEARVLGDDHRVSDRIIATMQEDMLNERIKAEETRRGT